METEQKTKKTNEENYAFKKDFQYKSKNPYHEKLEIFQDFVLRDNEAEIHAGSWNENVFKNKNELCVEIGTGYGHFMHWFCAQNPNSNFIGLDYRFKRSFELAKKLALLPYKNFKYLRAKGERLEFMFGENELSKIFYFFPDPWPKARHHKKRLFQKKFLDACFKVLKKDGELFVKTDHDGYFDWMCEELTHETRFDVTLKTYNLREEHPLHFLSSFETKFEKIFLGQGIKIKALVLKVKK